MERARYRQSDLRRMVLGVRAIPSLFIALTSYKLLAVLLFMETFLLPGTFDVGGLAFPACTLLFLACALVCLAFAILFRRLTFHDRGWYLGLLTACLLLGLFLLLLRELGGIGNTALAAACRGLGIALVAMGLIGAHIEEARIMGALGMTQTLTFGVSAAFAASLLYLALTLLPMPQGRWAAAFVLPLVFAASFWRAQQEVYRSPRTRYEEPEAKVLVPYRFIATSVAQGIAAGLLVALACAGGQFSPAWNVAGYLLAAVLTLATMLVCKLDFNRSVYQIGFPLVGLGLLCAGIAGAPLGAPGAVMQVTGFLYLDLVLWGLGSYLIKNCRQPATWVAACPTTSLMAGRTLGAVLGAALLQLLPAGFGWNTLLCAAAFCFVMAALLLSNAANLRTGWGFVRPGGPDDGANAHRACQIVAEDFSLTQREFEVLRRIVEGESRADVAEALFIAPNTVKTHLHSIYAKLDVHNVRDLRAYVDSRRRSFSPSSENEEILENDA